jgi:hypothetical protein
MNKRDPERLKREHSKRESKARKESAPKRRRDRRQAQPNDERLRTWSGKQFSERQRGGWLDETAQSDGARLRQLWQKLTDGEQLSESEINENRELTIRLRDKNETLNRGVEKSLALQNCAELVRWVAQETLKGDQMCATFLGEMISFVMKWEKELKENDAFKARFAEVRRWQRRRKKGRTLSREIEEIIEDATREHQMFWLMRDLPKSSARYNYFDLPIFNSSSADLWFEKVIWPELKRRKNELRNNPLIGGLKKANRCKGKRSGKFQLSDLKDQAHDIVTRLANRPWLYYFADEFASPQKVFIWRLERPGG